MLVRATETGIINGSRVRAGAVIEWSGEKLPRFLEPVDTPAKEEPAVIAGKSIRKPKTIHDEVI